tara:strand:- start:1838 stop:2140 length:303 start_codon:yes stop_codon:yes gene_type:complete
MEVKMEDISEIERKSWREGEDTFFKFWKTIVDKQHLRDLDSIAMYTGVFYTFIKFLKGKFTNKAIIGLFFSFMQKHETKENIYKVLLEQDKTDLNNKKGE